MMTTWRKRGSKTDYLEFVRSIDAITFKNPFVTSKVAWIRHDIDYDLDQALKLAEYENDNGIASIYFLLPSASYFDYSLDFKNKVRALRWMTRGVGLHNNYYYYYLKFNWNLQTLKDVINKDLEFLRGTGDVDFTSCHGQREHYGVGVFNYEIWKQWGVSKNEGFRNKPLLDLNDYGLMEAYFLPYTHYFSDSGNNWIGYKVNGQKPFERTALESPNNLGSNVIEEFNKCDKGFLQVLTHPCHWEEVK